MKRYNLFLSAFVACAVALFIGLNSCKLDMPKETQSSFETMTVQKTDIEVLKLAYVGTHELMDNGKASYLEVLTAQESLLNAQLNEATNMYNGAMGIIALYIALGGATR